MFTRDDIERIKEALESGRTPEEVGKTLGISGSALVYRLQRSGYRIGITRSLVPIVPVELTARQEAIR